MIKLAEYQTPEGYYDLPYIHVYDGDALTDGNNYSSINLGVAEHDYGFVLRQIMGRDNLAARVQIRDSFAPLTSANAGVTLPRTYVVAPERFVSPAGALLMDLFNVGRANRTDGVNTIFFAQMAFQGLRRYLQPQGASIVYPGPSDYAYRREPYTYLHQVTVNWAGTDPSSRKYALPVEDDDFELERITIVRTQLAGAATNAVPNREIKLLLADQHGKQLANAPVLDVYLNDAADAASCRYNGVFPVPAVLYRLRSFIRFELVSLLLPGQLPAAYDIYFQGARRRTL